MTKKDTLARALNALWTKGTPGHW